jgi:NAD(P)-dependent dehydrogenase (short-subunit alcohol dehydrogenase family)
MTTGRVAIITGASAGIGRALCERAVRAGWNVFAVGRRAERLDELTGVVAQASGTTAPCTSKWRPT